jgi:pimeloyl-ACP methyl ester carboxylesterase
VKAPKVATVGVLAAGATGVLAGALAERRLVRREVRPADAGLELPTLSGTREQSVICDDGVTLAVRESGRADAALTLVFVHGYTVTSECWAAQVRDLTGLARPGGLRIVLYDQRGHGASGSGEAANNTIEQLGHDLDAVLRQRVPGGPVVLAGHSMGGMTIMALAEQRPELFGSRVAAAALVDTSSAGMAEVTLGLPAALATVPARLIPYADRTAPIQRRAERFRAVDSDLARWVNARVAFGKEATGAALEAMTRMQAPMHLETMAAFLPTFAVHDRTGVLGPLKSVPTLILVGERDVLTPPSHSRIIADALPDARFVEVAGSGHMSMMEVPDVVTGELRRLIAQVP